MMKEKTNVITNYCKECGAVISASAKACPKCGAVLKEDSFGNYAVVKKNWTTSIILSILLGIWGVDRFYYGHVGLGLLKLFTAGGFLIWWVIDIILVLSKSVNGVIFE